MMKHSLLHFSLERLSKMLESYHHKKPIILIDDYDDFFFTASDDTRDRMFNEVFGLLNCALKDNWSLETGIMTGRARLVASYFSGQLNHLSVYDAPSERYAEDFGFTDDEVRRLCTDYGHPEKFNEVKEWYGGYRFGDYEMQNPRSIMRYLDAGFVPGTYHNAEQDGILLDKVSRHLRRDDPDYIRKLSCGEPVMKHIWAVMDQYALDDKEIRPFQVLSVLGFLRMEREGPTWSKDFTIKVPNNEMMDIFQGWASGIPGHPTDGDGRRASEPDSSLYDR